jgi:thioesterase domain-containing protein
MEEMAADAVRQIRGIQPEGPYYLAGASHGGTIAYEAARQLRARGQKVALLALIDPCSLERPRTASRITALSTVVQRLIQRTRSPAAERSAEGQPNEVRPLCPDRVALFRSGRQSSALAPAPPLSWSELSAGDLEIHELPGPTAESLTEPQVRFVVDELKHCLERARAAESGAGAD